PLISLCTLSLGSGLVMAIHKDNSENDCQLKSGDLLSQIDRVERQIAAEVPTQESRAKVAGNMRQSTAGNRWCDFHKTTSHNTEDCRSKKFHNSGPHGSASGPVSSGAKPLVNKVKGSKVNNFGLGQFKSQLEAMAAELKVLKGESSSKIKLLKADT
ncbi:hypothetical protein HDU84_001253, partial [Entophlyctis sp. JEL0112]